MTINSRQNFEAVFPSLVQDVLAQMKRYNPPDSIVEWFQRSLKYNTAAGKLNRGLSVPDTASALLKRPLSAAEFKDLSTLGWLIELLQAHFLVHDDIMDKSITRRGQPCWYKQLDVGLIAINDASMLESAIFMILKARFRDHPAYIELVELFHEVALQTQLGQLCDLTTAPGEVDLEKFSMRKYLYIVRYKTAFYSFFLPVALALHYLGLATVRNLAQARVILLSMGEYFQIQDDFLDVFGDPMVTGKVGTDIRDNKCSWVVNEALLRCSSSQRCVLDECYGRDDGGCEARVKDVFCELGLERVYLAFEEGRLRELNGMIASVDEAEGLKREVFRVFLSKIYKRVK